MKRILLIIGGLFICSFLATSYKRPKIDRYDSTAINLIYRTLPDSLISLTEKYPMVFYSRGHYGQSWMLLTKVNNHFRVYSGSIDYAGNRNLTEAISLSQFDSCAFFCANKSLLSWTFDTFVTKSLKMIPIKNKPYMTIYKTISVINPYSDVEFTTDCSVTFSGPDSLEFNNKFHKLCLIMQWLSEPRIRQYIPDSVIFQEPARQ